MLWLYWNASIKKTIEMGHCIFGVDNMNDYYDQSLKEYRLDNLIGYSGFTLKTDISKLNEIDKVFSEFKPQIVINLAAQAGVRYSLENPHAYIQSNIVGFTNIIESCRHHKSEGLIYASSSSVYGANEKIPFSINDRVDKPISIYAASKNQMNHCSYVQSTFGLNTTGLRFFTVYGPWGRPDMAMYIFADKIKNGDEISIFNHGKMQRDFTY